MQTLGVVIQIWLVGATFAFFMFLVLELYEEYRASRQRKPVTPFLLAQGTLWRPK